MSPGPGSSIRREPVFRNAEAAGEGCRRGSPAGRGAGAGRAGPRAARSGRAPPRPREDRLAKVAAGPAIHPSSGVIVETPTADRSPSRSVPSGGAAPRWRSRDRSRGDRSGCPRRSAAPARKSGRAAGPPSPGARRLRSPVVGTETAEACDRGERSNQGNNRLQSGFSPAWPAETLDREPDAFRGGGTGVAPPVDVGLESKEVSGLRFPGGRSHLIFSRAEGQGDD